jgi:hypothetical protein
MIVNIIKSYRDIVAICDAELLGKKFEEGEFQLDVKESFYQGEKMSAQEIIKIIQKMSNEDATFNIVGKKSVECAIKAGIILPDSVKTVSEIPFAMVLV